MAERLRDDLALPSLAELSEEAEMTPVQLVRAFARVYRMPPLAWAWNRRVVLARERIARENASPPWPPIWALRTNPT